MDASLVDDERRGITAVRAGALDHGNPLAIAWLNQLWPSTPL
jgi:hypothetical protein